MLRTDVLFSFQHRVTKIRLKLMVSVSMVDVVPSDPSLFGSSTHFIDFEGNIRCIVFSSHVPRFELVPGIACP